MSYDLFSSISKLPQKWWLNDETRTKQWKLQDEAEKLFIKYANDLGNKFVFLSTLCFIYYELVNK